jgi:tetratricopeptide (TPR) repeat protein
MGDSWDKVRKSVEKYLAENADDTGIRALFESHLTAGQHFASRGMLREAIAEYMKEYERPIKSSDDAYVVQSAYGLAGRAYKRLGEFHLAIEAYERARSLMREHRVGVAPHEELAEIFIDQGRYDEAIAVCNEALSWAPSWGAKQLLARAIELREHHSNR